MLPALPTSELLARLGQSLRDLRARSPHGRALLAFDGDGTLWSGDVGEDVFEVLLERRAIRPPAAGAISAMAQAFSVPPRDDPHAQALAIFEGYRRGAVPEKETCAMIAWAFAGHRADEVYRMAEETLVERRLTERFHPEVLPILEWARGESVEVWLVSASPQAVVEQAAVRLSIPRRNVRAMAPRFVDGHMIAALDEPQTYGPGKAEALRLAAGDAAVLGCFGDSGFDVPMLRLATHPIAVRPKKSLLDTPDLPPSLARLEAL